MYIGSILSVSIYICTIRLIEQLVGKTPNQYHAKCMHFSKMQLVSHCFTAVLYEPISKLNIYKNSTIYLSNARVMFFVFFCKVQELRKPTTVYYIVGLVHMTKMASMPIYGKKNFFSRATGPFAFNLDSSIWDQFYKSYINDDPEMTLTYFTAKSNLVA